MVAFVERARRANDLGALGREQFGDLFADAPARAGDDGNPAVELAHDVPPPGWNAQFSRSTTGCDA
jgi:hypothetical protein